MNMTYKGTGVDYDSMDPFKREAQLAASETSANLAFIEGRTFAEVMESRGESAYLIETSDCFLAHVEEGLGTKNLVADKMRELTGVSYYDHIAQCTVAMIVNDMITVGAVPLSIAMHLAAGSSAWFDDQVRSHDLIQGWKEACNLAGCAWGPGETPTLRNIIAPGTVALSGSAMGIIQPKGNRIHGRPVAGDVIIILPSSGVHANGLTLCRDIADKLPDGYMTTIPGGRAYGEALLDPTFIYVREVAKCLFHGVDVHAAINITGHGWRKLMRAVQPFTYVIDTLPPELPIFPFIQEYGPVSDVEAFGNLNMGAGFALFVPPEDVEHALRCCKRAFVAGHIENGFKKVVIDPKNIEFDGSTLAVR